MGLSQKQAVTILYAISGLLGLAAVVITTGGAVRYFILIAAVVIAVAVILFTLRSKRANETDTMAANEGQRAEEVAHEDKG